MSQRPKPLKMMVGKVHVSKNSNRANPSIYIRLGNRNVLYTCIAKAWLMPSTILAMAHHCINRSNYILFKKYSKLPHHFFMGVCLYIILCTVSACKSGTDKPSQTQDSISAELKKLNADITSSPKDAEAYYRRSKYYYEHKDAFLALDDIHKAVELSPENPLYHFKGGEYLFGVNQTKKAVEAFEKTVALKDDYIEAWQKLGELYLIVKEFEQSERCWKKLAEIDKLNPQAAFYRGLMYKEMHDTAKALRAFQYAIELDEKYAEPQLQLGILYASRHNTLCLQYFNNTIKINPKNWEAFLARGNFYREMGRNDLAVKDFDQTLLLNPDNYLANYNAGVIFFEMKKITPAIDQFTEVIAKKPNYAHAYFSRALCYQQLGDFKKALTDVDACLRLDSSIIDAKGLQKELKGE
jgi:tetratricopeptide (TPR) repeat protein